MSVDRRVKVLFDEAAIAERTEALAREIAAAEPKDLLVVAILKGSFMFAADLLRALHRAGLEPQVEFFHLSSYLDGTVSSGAVKILRDINSTVRDRDVLVVDDILESGRTLAFAKDLLAARGARRVLICTMLEKPGKRAVPLNADFVGFICPDVFVVGYGMDVAHFYRELPFIGRVETAEDVAHKQDRGGVAVFESRFQSFADLGGPGNGAARVAELRGALEADGLAGFVVPRADEHQNEYVPANAERLLWLTGFAGSAGVAVVLKDRAAIFVDGRYTEQAKAQVDAAVFEIRHVIEEPPTEWLSRVLEKGDRLGYDPRLHTPDSVRRLAAACEVAGADLVAAVRNPLDAIWRDRPGSPMGAVTQHKNRLAGEAVAAKVARVQAALERDDGLLVSDPSNLAWLFNVRGADVSHTPLPLGYAYVPREGKPVLLLDPHKLSTAGRDAILEHADLAGPDALIPLVERLGGQGARVRFDTATAPALLTQTLEGAGGKADIGADPIGLMKAAKNKAELNGARAAQQRDGAALARFLAWFDSEAPRGRLTEIDAVEALESFRRATGALKDISFPTIAAAGPNSAMPHYRVSVASNRKIDRGVFLVDSGGQYEDGTTDVTRTIAVGRPTSLMRDRFTRVLKGHIAIAKAVFPLGTSGAQIDVLARRSLWEIGADFDHGTGHGVGSYLSVHEGPQRISKTGTVALAAGMILSNEPGYYAAGAFGIRTENLMVVEPRHIPDAEREMLGFETLTLAPIDLRLIDWRLLDEHEIKWLDAYHARVRKVLAPLVDAATRRWLGDATRRRGSSRAAR